MWQCISVSFYLEYSHYLWLPLFSLGWETGTTAAPPLYEWFLAFTPQKARGREPNCTPSWQRAAGRSNLVQFHGCNPLKALYWVIRGMWMSSSDFFLFCLLFICLISKRNNSNLIISLNMRVFLCSNYVCHRSLKPFLLLLLLPWTKVDRAAEVEAVLQTNNLWTTEKQVKAKLNFGSALARSVELP